MVSIICPIGMEAISECKPGESMPNLLMGSNSSMWIKAVPKENGDMKWTQVFFPIQITYRLHRYHNTKI